MTSTLKAHALATLPDTAGQLPADIQVFPPGEAVEFTLQDYPGETFQMRVDAGVAAKAQADLERLYAAERQGRGSAPFADKNHEDAEATFRPLKFFWAGNDPKAGGVRVQADWTPFGAQLVKAKAFSYFSGNFLFDKVAKKFLGLINENIGGLVNRPGFAAQQAFAKAGNTSIADLDLKANIRRINQTYGVSITLDSEYPLLEAAGQLALQNATNFMQELNRLSLLEPEMQRYQQYVQTGMDPAANGALRKEIAVLRSEADQKVDAETLLAAAKAIQSRTGAKFEDAWRLAQNEIFANAKAPDQQTANAIYQRTLEIQHAQGLNFMEAHSRATAEHHTGAVSTLPRSFHVFKSHAKAYAASRGLNEIDGQIAFARTTEGAALYAQRA